MPEDHYEKSTLFYGNNLPILKEYIKTDSIDLVYLDPPFKSDRIFNILFKDDAGGESEAQITAFEDTWHWNQAVALAYDSFVEDNPNQAGDMIGAMRKVLGPSSMMAYLVMMAPRLVELHRTLKPTGSLYLHCDPTASAYLRMVLDCIFSPLNFRNEIIWRRTGAHSPKKSFGPIHDTILFYTKSNEYYFKETTRPYMRGHVKSRYSKNDAGRIQFSSGGNILTGSGATGGQSGAKWRGFDPSAKNRHWAIPGFLAEKMPPSFNELGVLDKLDALYSAGLVEIKDGAAWPTPVRYLDEDDGQPIQDIWAYQPYTENTVYGTNDGIDQDVSWLGPTDPERLGYQTQKPEGLLERIIKSSCPDDGIVLDPFCGCGTTIAVAQKLNRQWIGIDVTHLAITLMKFRLENMFNAIPREGYLVIGEPTDEAGAEQLASENRYQFQWWATSLIRGAKPTGQVPGKKTGRKGKDKGIDATINFVSDNKGTIKKVVISVKSGHVDSGHMRDLRGVIERDEAAIGVFVTLKKPSRDIVSEAISAGFYRSQLWDENYPRIQILTISDLFGGKQINMPPSLAAFREAQASGDKWKPMQLDSEDFV